MIKLNYNIWQASSVQQDIHIEQVYEIIVIYKLFTWSKCGQI